MTCSAVMFSFLAVAIYLLKADAFVVSPFSHLHRSTVASAPPKCDELFANESERSDESSPSSKAPTTEDINNELSIPLSYLEMIRQVSKAIKDACNDGISQQTIRILLPRDVNSGDIGIYYENDANVDDSRSMMQNTVLVPPDETWQGGIMQLYRAAAPTCKEILRSCSSAAQSSGVPPKITEDRSVDESGVDGVSLLTMADSSNDVMSSDIRLFVQPTQEIVDVIEDNVSSKSSSDDQPLVLLVNPQWRDVYDALDSVSQNDGFLGSLASFLGGKGTSMKRLGDMGFQPTFVIEGYVCKGGNIRLMKRFDSDWVIFAEKDSLDDYVRVGTSKARPTYQECDKMLDEMGVSLKYARDIGLAPKL